MENNKMNLTIFKMKLAGYLMQKGFILVDIGVNWNNPDKRVFYFKDSPEIRKAMHDYSMQTALN